MNENLPQLIADAIRAAVSEALAPLVQLMQQQAVPSEIIRPKHSDKYSGLKPTARDEAIARGDFPAPIPLGERAVGFLAAEIAAWQRRKIAERDAKLTGKNVEPEAPTEPLPPKVKKVRLRPRKPKA